MKGFSTLLLVLTTSSSVFAAMPVDVAVAPKSQFNTQALHALSINGIYKFTKNTEVIPTAVMVNGEAEDNIGGISMDVFKDEAVAVEYLEDGKVLMTLRLATEEAGKVPDQLILTKDEFNQLGLKMDSEGSVDDLMANYTGYFDTEVAAREGGRLKARRHTMRQETSRRGRGGFGRDANGRIRGGGGNCVAVVKSLTGFSGTAGNGVGMASALQRRGWRVVSSPSRGTVCSWSGGFHGKGHVGWFDGSCFQPTYGGNCGSPGKNYRLIKCVSKG